MILKIIIEDVCSGLRGGMVGVRYQLRSYPMDGRAVLYNNVHTTRYFNNTGKKLSISVREVCEELGIIIIDYTENRTRNAATETMEPSSFMWGRND